ncbi:oligosaccharide MFS transporter [Niallia sp. MER 6]|uniref:oligosaccharide MFS transporter n=1 Tax=Niallia sp. MER 6 TaxID=2939567 RepID=UPI00203DB4E0|nr:oligosaccharide MFS transporter [Niallia sp. MER 6]MCM3029929.1 oligosaccharide MFS transporter [Niallia sp. MER 6]
MIQTQKSFWNFGGLFFFYFFIWATVFTFLPIWLEEQAGLSATESGYVFSAMSLVALLYQPFFGILSDKLVFKKHLFATVAGAAIFMGPFFSYVFISLLDLNIIAGALLGSVYLSSVLYGGVGVIESYIERASRANKFEYGRARLFGSVAGATATFVSGLLFVAHPFSIFWVASLSGIVLSILLYTAKIDKTASFAAKESAAEPLTKEVIFSVFKLRNFWMLGLFIIGTACMYDVFDQQFPNYYKQFFTTPAEGTNVFSKLVSLQIGLEAIIMVFMPILINKIGAKNGLLLFGALTFIRIFGSAVAIGPISLSIVRLIAAVEMPLLLISIFKYITGVFDIRLSATVYLLAFNFAKQISIMVFSSVAGGMYSTIGYQNTYYILSVVVLVITIMSIYTLENDKKHKKMKVSDSFSPITVKK